MGSLQALEEELASSSKTEETDQDRGKNPSTVRATDSDVRADSDEAKMVAQTNWPRDVGSGEPARLIMDGLWP